jgi:hypothetical protein
MLLCAGSLMQVSQLSYHHYTAVVIGRRILLQSLPKHRKQGLSPIEYRNNIGQHLEDQ